MPDTGVDIELVGCSKHYGTYTALKDVSLSIPQGEFVTVLGPSGCGKTTTLRVIGGFITPDDGVVRIRGRDVTTVPPYLRNIGVVFQNYALWPHMTVEDNLGFGLKLRKVPRNEIGARVDRALELVQLKGLNKRYPKELSGGQQQRVALARALAIDPEVIILDEPLSNLDRRLREEMRVELKRLQRSLGVTMLFVTHDQEEALSMSDKVVVMHGGSVQQVADPRSIYLRPANSFVASFLGNANFLDGKVSAIEGGNRALVGLPDGSSVVAQYEGPLGVGQNARVVVRPEWISLRRGSAPGDRPALSGRVLETIYEGASLRYMMAVPGVSDAVMVQELAHADAPEVGDQVQLDITSAVIIHDQ